jgi:HEAT repeat protein
MRQFAALKSLYYVDREALEPRADEVYQRVRELFRSQLPQAEEIELDSDVVTQGMCRRVVHVAVYEADDVRREKPKYMTVEQLAIETLRKVIAWDRAELRQLLARWLTRRIAHARPDTQLYYAEVLCELEQDRVAAPILVGLLTPSQDTELLESALTLLGSIREEAVRVLPELTRLLQDRDGDVRLAASEALDTIAQSLEPNSVVEGTALADTLTAALDAVSRQIEFEQLVNNPNDERTKRIAALTQCQSSIQKILAPTSGAEDEARE